MKIATKLPLVTILLVTITSFGVLWLSKGSIEEGLNNDIAQYKKEELEKKRQELQHRVGTAYSLIDAQYREASNANYLEKRYGNRLRSLVDVASTIVNTYVEKAKRREMPVAQAQHTALERIREIRFDDGKGYMWVNDTKLPFPTMLMHPTLPQLEGKTLDSTEFNTAFGKQKNLFQAAVEVCLQQGGGFVPYLWPEPSSTGLIPSQQKLSHVRLMKDWGWVIGTGIYVDDAIAEKVSETLDDLRNIRYGSDYFWIHDSTTPLPKMVMHPLNSEWEGKPLSNGHFETTFEGKRQNIFVTMRDMAIKNGEGFLEYRWPKPIEQGKSEESFPKLSFVRYYEPLGWIIGSGLYLDEFEAEMKHRTDSMRNRVDALVRRIVYLTLIIMAAAAFLSVWFASTVTRPVAKLVAAVQAMGDSERNHPVASGIDSSNEIGILAAEFDRMAQRIRENILTMKGQRELLGSVLSTIPHPIYWKDRNAKFLGCNAQFLALTKLASPDAIISKTQIEIGWEPEIAAAMDLRDKEVLAQCRAHKETNVVAGTSAFSDKRFLVNREPLKDQAGNLIGMLVVLVETT